MHLRQALEDALVANPDDLAAHSAYADFLSESPDPADRQRGEFIQVQIALERSPPESQRHTLEQRQRDLLLPIGRTWLGEDLAAFLIDHQTDDLPPWNARHTGSRGQVTFARGWLDTLRANFLTPIMAAALANAPLTRLLRSLTIDRFVDAADCHHILAGSPHLGNLRALDLAGEEYSGHSGGEGVVEFVRRLPRLEVLRLLVHDVDTDTLFSLPTLINLRQLQVYHLRHYPLERLGANPALRRLTHLRLKPHALVPGDTHAYITLDGVRALVASPHLVSLTHLELRLSDMGDAGCDAIARSGILSRLEELTLGPGCSTDAGARLLAGCPDIRHLRKLDLDGNLLSNEGIAALRATGVHLSADNQRDPDEEEDDTEDENHYLVNDGDWE
jgi:uncharacterized protein (TIGR02996 family)